MSKRHNHAQTVYFNSNRVSVFTQQSKYRSFPLNNCFVKHRVTYNFLTYTLSLISTGDHEIFSSIILENTNLTSLADGSLLLHVVTNICC